MRAQVILPKVSSIVSASAGTGKTKTLIDRIVNLLLHDVEPNKILCLTYTKAASAEIIARITERLAHFSMCSQEDLHKNLQDLGFLEVNIERQNKARTLFTKFIDDLSSLNVFTIHAYCQQLLCKFPFEAGINLNFKLLDEAEISELIIQAKNELISSGNHKIEKELSFLTWHIKEYSLNELLNEIIANRNKLEFFFKYHQNLDNAINSIAPGFNDEEIIAEFLNNIAIDKRIIEILSVGKKTDVIKAVAFKKFTNYSSEMKELLFPEYLSCFLTAAGEPSKSILTKELALKYPDIYEILLEEQVRVYKFSKFYKHNKAINLTKAFITLSYYILESYQKLKAQKNCLDYDDLISRSLNLLNNNEYSDWVRYRLDGGIDHLLIDEAQDTSANQWNIIKKLSEDFVYNENKSLFIVGDAKQSIFSFQGAAPELFNELNLSFSTEMLKIKLQHSFRSGQNILEFVDKIFNQAHIKHLVTCIEEEIVHNAAKDHDSKVEIWPLVVEQKNLEENAWALPSGIQLDNFTSAEETLAINIANIIAEELKTGVIKNLSEVMILTRRRTAFTKHIVKQLRCRGIDTAGADRINLTEHPIILDLLALTNFVLCNQDELSLAIVLRSPIFSLAEEELMHLCHLRTQSLWEELKGNMSNKYQEISSFLEDIIKCSREKTPYEFYFHLIEALNLRNCFKNVFYAEASDVLDAFLGLVEKFEENNIASLQLFMNYMGNTKTEIKRDLAHAKNQVRVMTVHAAKGLQSKIVILTDTTSLPFNDDTIIWLDDTKLLWPGRESYSPDVAKEAKQAKLAKEYAEYIRLLYVAVTRAEERLIITGTAKDDADLSPKCWYSIAQYALANKVKGDSSCPVNIHLPN